MTIIALGETLVESVQNFSWSNQIQEILELEYNLGDDDEQVRQLKNSYIRIFKREYAFDLNRYNFLYLKSANIKQAINLYDCLNETEQFNMIAAIEFDHPHLIEMIEIHETVKQTCRLELYLHTTIQ